ncbi:MAG: invasion associated locus B family protein [Pseudomonadota bacterium]
MIAPLRPFAFVAALAMATSLQAQETTTDTEEAPAPATSGISMGTTVVEGRALGEEYVLEEHGDWVLRCITTEEEQDPCQLYQLLLDEAGNSVAEISMFPLNNGGEAVAGGTIITPLSTLLTAQVSLRVDSGATRRYPFTFCTAEGCFSRVGFTADDIASMKRGAAGTLTIVPAGSPDARVNLTVSLTGFTAGYDSLDARQ